MTGRMEYPIGSFSELAPVWRAYGVQVHGSPQAREVGHSAFLYGATGPGFGSGPVSTGPRTRN